MKRLFFVLVMLSALSFFGQPAAAALLEWGTGSYANLQECALNSPCYDMRYSTTNQNQTSSSASGSDARGTVAASASLTGPTLTPVLHAYAQDTGVCTGGPCGTATGTNMVNWAGAFGVQGYTYTGTQSTTYTINANLTGSVTNNASGIYAEIYAFEGPSFTFYPYSNILISELGAIPMGNTVLGTGNIGTGLMSDSFTITLNPGDTFYLWASLFAQSAGQGTADAANTLSLYFTDSTNLTPASVAAVPLPAAFWLFCSGVLGLIGVARRKKIH